jgi:hypothetical protein
MEMKTFNIGFYIGFITIRAKINILNRLVNHTLSSEQPHEKAGRF